MRCPASIIALVVAAWGCGVPAEPRGTPLDHDAYVWQRAWVGPVRAAVARPPEVIAGLRVLGLELERDRVRWPEVDAASLAAGGRPVVLVVRVNAPRAVEDVPMPEVAAVAARWRSAGADVRGIEIDYDCATARLSAYAAWLSRARPTPPLTWSITALPTWSDSDALGAVAAAVDELVVQVHAVRAPVIFDGAAARADLARFAAAAPVGKLRVSLPTYDATVGGVVRRSDPEAVAAFVRWLGTTAAPAVRGVVWFRLPVAGDDRAWSVATLEAVIAGRSLASQVAPRLVATADGGYDVVLENRGNLRGRWPDVAIGGDGLRAELIAGYRAAADGRHFTAPARELAPGATAVVGWATGRALTIDAAP